ncbi:MAG TPA: GrpB family protein [Candidatus Dormibacteraeota bacterium]|nr:GrpB family protein [Candidatus Dormibacteraeota bacterium]
MTKYPKGPPSPLSAAIEIADYDRAWPGLFEREAERIRSILGTRVVRIEHGGSTSVPRLPAKPIIDIVLEVPDSSDEAAYVADMEAAGYVLRIREQDWFEHRLFKGPDTDINLHTFSAGCPEVDRMLMFRDRLRENAPDRELYVRTKRRLAARDWKYMQDYADAKTAVVEEILARARTSGDFHR